MSIYTGIGNAPTASGLPPGGAPGDVLVLGPGGQPAWGPPSGGSGLPAGADPGEVLTVDAGGNPIWATPAGGGAAAANPTALVGLTAVNGVATTLMRSDGAPALSQAIAPTWTARHIFSVAGAADTPALRLTGAPFTGGDATTTKPLLLIETAGAASTGWSTAGTGLGINAAAAFTGNLIDAQKNGVTKAKITNDGSIFTYGNTVNDYFRAMQGSAAPSIGAASNATGVLWSLWDNGSGTFASLAFGALGLITWQSTNRQDGGVIDLQMGKLAAANLRLGALPSATPIAQTFTIGEASRPGTDSNVAGANGTIQSGLGTGTGAASNLIFQTPTTVGAGSGVQTYATRLTINATGLSVPGNMTVADEAYGATWDGSLQVPTKNALYDKIQTLGGGGGVAVGDSPTWTGLHTFSAGAAGPFATFVDASQPTFSKPNFKRINAAVSPFTGATVGVGLAFDYTGATAAGIYVSNGGVFTIETPSVSGMRINVSTLRLDSEFSAAPPARTFVIGGSPRVGTDSNIAGGNGTIQSGLGTGTGAVSSLIFQTPDTVGAGSATQTYATRLTINASGVVATGNFQTPLSVFGAAFGTPGFGFLSFPADGVALFRDNALTSFNRICFGGTTGASPAIKKNGAAFEFKLADDSDYCLIYSGGVTIISPAALNLGNASVINWTGRSRILCPSDGVLELSDSAVAGFLRLQFGGTTASFPALKRTTTGLAVRTADDTLDSFLTVLDEVYGASWNGSLQVPTKNAVYDKIQTLSGGGVALGDSPTWTGKHTFSSNAAASAPVASFTGSPFAGTATTSKAVLLLEPTGTTSTGWTTTGTMLGVNAATAFAGALIDAQIAGVSKFKVDSTGLKVEVGTVSAPTYSFIGNPTYGIYLTGSARVGILAAGADGVAVANNALVLAAAFPLAWTSGGAGIGTTNTFLANKGAATLQMGIDSTSPIAQTFKGPDRITSDGVGGNLTIAGGLNRGAFAGGSLIFQTSPAAAASTAGVLANRLTLDATGALFTGNILFGGTTAAFPALKRNVASLECRLADDSATTDFRARAVVAEVGLQIPTALTPASAAATGATGQINWDSGFIYVCVAPNTWKRAAIATW